MGLLRELCRRARAAWHAPRHWRLRPGTIDRRLFLAVVADDEYRLPRFSLADTVLDLGAHTGSFALAALRRGAGRVVCCEPDPANFDLLRRNLAPYGERVRLRRAAAWPVAGTLRLGNPLDPRNTGAGRTRPEGAGLPVEAVAFDDLLVSLGRVRFAKLDCEGAEWPLLFAARRLDLIEELAGEYHLPPLAAPWPDVEATLAALEARLGEAGFRTGFRGDARSSLPVGLFAAKRPSGAG
ncbi:MAG: FkbM family methyltransferase [Gemmataceae bacterium]|nr:FkbM family methyltransferase [Gemmataceae bacterium]